MQTFPKPLPATAGRLSPLAFSASPVLLRQIGFAPSTFPQLKSGGHPRFSLPICDDCEPYRVSPYSSISMSAMQAELLSSDKTLTVSRVLIKSKRALLPSKIPFSTIPAHLPTVGNQCCCAACVCTLNSLLAQ